MRYRGRVTMSRKVSPRVASGTMGRFPCPSCGEMNYPNAANCWACNQPIVGHAEPDEEERAMEAWAAARAAGVWQEMRARVAAEDGVRVRTASLAPTAARAQGSTASGTQAD